MKAEIFVNRFAKEQGPYSPQEIQEKLSSGRLSPEDTYWHGGRANWTALSDFDVEEAEASAQIRREERGAEEARKKLMAGVVLGVIALGITAFVFIRDAREAAAHQDDSMPLEEEQVEKVAPAKAAEFLPNK